MSRTPTIARKIETKSAVEFRLKGISVFGREKKPKTSIKGVKI